MKNLKLLITGGAGFIGSHFVDLLLNDPVIENNISHLLVVDKLTYAGNLKHLELANYSSKFEFMQGDICDKKFLQNISLDYDWIINFAAESHVDRSLTGSEVFAMSNVIGTLNLLDLSISSGIENFLQISTDEVYGSIETGSWVEESILDPRSPYSASKASGDLFCNAYFISHGLKTRVTRACNNFGPRQHSEKMIPTIIRHILNDTPIPVYGNGLNVRDWLFVSDHCLGIWQVINSGKPGEVYNLGGGTQLNNIELIRLISEVMGKSKPKIEFVEDRKGHDFRYSIDCTKSRLELGYNPQKNVLNGIRETVEYYKNL